MKRMETVVLTVLAGCGGAAGGLAWRGLPGLPEVRGVAGAFAGVSNGVLLVAGGANFPQGAPWEGGSKCWHDRVWVLEDPAGAWRDAGRLPRPLAYGVAVTTGRGVLCIGGSDVERHHADCFLLRWEGGRLVTEALPALPRPLAEMAGARLGDTVLLAGGSEVPGGTSASNRLLALDLNRPGQGWSEREPLPGPGRILPVAAVADGALFIISGAALASDDAGRPVRTYLRDAWRYAPGAGWRAVAGPPRAAVGAPSPAPVAGGGQLLVIGGDDGSLAAFEPKSRHPGFSREVLAYDPGADRWGAVAALPDPFHAPVTTATAAWRSRTIIPSGEIRPAVRTPQVLALGETVSTDSPNR